MNENVNYLTGSNECFRSCWKNQIQLWLRINCTARLVITRVKKIADVAKIKWILGGRAASTVSFWGWYKSTYLLVMTRYLREQSMTRLGNGNPSMHVSVAGRLVGVWTTISTRLAPSPWQQCFSALGIYLSLVEPDSSSTNSQCRNWRVSFTQEDNCIRGNGVVRHCLLEVLLVGFRTLRGRAGSHNRNRNYIGIFENQALRGIIKKQNSFYYFFSFLASEGNIFRVHLLDKLNGCRIRVGYGIKSYIANTRSQEVRLGKPCGIC